MMVTVIVLTYARFCVNSIPLKRMTRADISKIAVYTD